MKVLVTGANGFVGQELVRVLQANGSSVVQGVREEASVAGGSTVHFDLRSESMLQELSGIDVVVHLAARVHVMAETAADPLVEFRRDNVQGTLRLAERAVEMGVRRFIYISSIKVNGECTESGGYFDSESPAAPVDAYGLSKWEAEQGLWQIARSSAMELVIIRPPLVYGPGVKANFRSLISWVDKGWPMPLAGIVNSRSVVSVDNLAHFIGVCVAHPRAANEVFLVSDAELFSTPALVRAIAEALGRRARLWYFPVLLLVFLGACVGKRAAIARLTQSLTIAGDKNQRLLGWTPPWSARESLARTVASYRAGK